MSEKENRKNKQADQVLCLDLLVFWKIIRCRFVGTLA
jgi:hypothetical protein